MSQFHGVIDFVGSHAHFAILAVFLLALSEAVPVIGTVVPGSTLIIAISALATAADPPSPQGREPKAEPFRPQAHSFEVESPDRFDKPSGFIV
jgi:hypothetical protein